MLENINIVLTFKERIVLSRLFPQKATLDEQIIVKDLITRLGVNEEEKKEINFRRTPKGWEWDEDKEIVIDSNFTEVELAFLNEQLVRLDTEKAVSQDMVGLCLKIRATKKEEKKND